MPMITIAVAGFLIGYCGIGFLLIPNPTDALGFIIGVLLAITVLSKPKGV